MRDPGARLNARLTERRKREAPVYNEDYFANGDENVKFYTGLPFGYTPVNF